MKHLQLSNGFKIPVVGLGTWLSPQGQTTSAVKCAISEGYRHIDCAFIYNNESEIGDALTQVLQSGSVKREDLFITSKLWNTFHHPENVKKGVQLSLQRLNLTYLDLYLIHWPCSYQYGEELFPKDANGKTMFGDTNLEDTWKAMEQLVDEGLVRSIGFSNFNENQIGRILAICRIKPVMLQVECHPDFPNQKLIEFSQSNGLLVTAYSPLGAPQWVAQSSVGDEQPLRPLTEESWVTDIARRHGKTPAQVLIRFAIQRGLCVIPKSVTPSRIKENLEVFDFELAEDEMKTLLTSGRNRRSIRPLMMKEHKEFPFADGC